MTEKKNPGTAAPLKLLSIAWHAEEHARIKENLEAEKIAAKDNGKAPAAPAPGSGRRERPAPLEIDRDWPLWPVALEHVRAALGDARDEALVRLQDALRDGFIKAKGPIDGIYAEPIPPELFRHLILVEDGGALDMASAARIDFVEVCMADVLAKWPAPIVATEILSPAEQANSYKTSAPGRDGSIHLAEAILRRRAASGEMITRAFLPEAQAVAGLVRKEHPMAAPLTVKTIRNNLSKLWRNLQKDVPKRNSGG